MGKGSLGRPEQSGDQQKESVADLGVEPLEVGRWKRARNPVLARDDPAAIAQLKALAAMAESSDLTVAAWASAEWARESGQAVAHVEARLAEALARRPAFRVGEGTEAAGYAAWRFEAESGLAAAQALAGMAGTPDLADLVARADAILAGDDRVFALQATDDHAEAWEVRWRALARHAEAAGIPVHDHGSAAGAIERARRFQADPALGQDRRDRIAATVAAHDARKQARRQAETWLAAWDERNPSDAAAAEAAIGDARALAADPALPAVLKSRLDLAVARHERLTRTAFPSVETAAPVQDDTPATRERVADDAAALPRPVIEEEVEREARRRADDVRRRLEDWEAHLSGGDFESVIARAGEAARDSDLGAGDRRRLEEATALARRRLEAHEGYLAWQDACRVHGDAAASRGAHVLDEPGGYRDLVARAGRLSENPALRDTARQEVVAWLAAAQAMTEARVTFLGRLAAWQRLEARSQAGGVNPFDLPEAGDVVAWLRENLESAGITEAERQAIRDVVARHGARQAELKRRDRGISWRP